MDLSLTCVITTQLWHHIYLGGGLCDLPTWDAMPPREGDSSSVDLPDSRQSASLSASAV